MLPFKSEQQTCPIDQKPLHILKTYKRTIKAVGIGTFRAHHTILYCKRHPDLGFWSSEELAKLVPANSNVAYNVIVEVGKLRFMENRQVEEIKSTLFEKHLVDLSASEIELLIEKFIFYVAAVHQESAHLIKAQIKARGGYILHIDATCEGDSPKLISSLDSVSGFVLYSAKITSENKDEIVTFLKQINCYFGRPHAVVSDMSKGIKAAVVEVFGDIAHYICHFHFLAVIGKLLFEKEHIALYKALSKEGISGKLKAMRRNMPQKFELLCIDEIKNYLAKPETLGKTTEAIEMLAYWLILWILDHPSEGNGYGFPFDQRYLTFYERLYSAQTLLNEVKTNSSKTNNEAIIGKLSRLFETIVADSELKSTFAQFKSKLAVFSDLRQALGVAPESTSKGLRQNDEAASSQELEKIRISVKAFMRTLEDQIETITDRALRTSFIKVKERILEYWDRLFADPFVVEVNGEKKMFFVHRTNNIMEQQFRLLTYSCRRIHGNHSVRRNLENIPGALPLVENLKNPDYVKIVFGNQFKIAKRFAEIDVKKIRNMSTEHHNNKKKQNSRKTKNILRQSQFKKMLSDAFAEVVG